MGITRISAIASVGGAIVAASLALAGPAAAAGAGGHDRQRSLPDTGPIGSSLIVDAVPAPSAPK